jgi:hypothetical protein
LLLAYLCSLPFKDARSTIMVVLILAVH